MSKKPIDLKQLETDIIAYHEKRKKAYELINGYPHSYKDIANKHINPKTGKPLSRQYIMTVKRRLLEAGKIKDINENLGI
jgi:hypothetical protein